MVPTFRAASRATVPTAVPALVNPHWKVRVAALVELRQASPRVTEMHLEATGTGLDLDHLQREFRWRSPLEVVLRIVPQMIAAGADPFLVNLPTEGFLLVTLDGRHEGRRLSDDFLADVARQYLQIGRGYSNQLAAEYQVSARTVKSWVQKARVRGLLTHADVGKVGGELVEQ